MFPHSYLSAITGSKRAACQARANPETIPVVTEKISAITTSSGENAIGNAGKAIATKVNNENASTSPIAPPSRQIDTLR